MNLSETLTPSVGPAGLTLDPKLTTTNGLVGSISSIAKGCNGCMTGFLECLHVIDLSKLAADPTHETTVSCRGSEWTCSLDVTNDPLNAGCSGNTQSFPVCINIVCNDGQRYALQFKGVMDEPPAGGSVGKGTLYAADNQGCLTSVTYDHTDPSNRSTNTQSATGANLDETCNTSEGQSGDSKSVNLASKNGSENLWGIAQWLNGVWVGNASDHPENVNNGGVCVDLNTGKTLTTNTACDQLTQQEEGKTPLDLVDVNSLLNVFQLPHPCVGVDDHDACTEDACDPAIGDITHVPIAIDDNNACTQDSCDPTTGVISHSNVCPELLSTCIPCVEGITWDEHTNDEQSAINQCNLLGQLDAGTADVRSTCQDKCTALLNIVKDNIGNQCAIDFCAVVNEQIEAGLICVP